MNYTYLMQVSRLKKQEDTANLPLYLSFKFIHLYAYIFTILEYLMNKCLFYLFALFFLSFVYQTQEENFYFINKINCLCIITLRNKSKFSRMFFQNALIFGNAFSELNPLMNNII